VYRYASDLEVARYMAWSRHVRIEDSAAFVDGSLREWMSNGVGAYLIVDAATDQVIGCTALDLATTYRATTGYVLLREAWGKGYATEAATAMVALARQLGLARIEASCHVDHLVSARVLEKSGLVLEGIMRSYLVFPNLGLHAPSDVRLYGKAL
jgi:ribosomal-protein-alanine N-acetyltransferase